MDRNLLKKKLDELKKDSQELLEEYSEKAITTFENEFGLRHPEMDVGIHIRDDGVLELFAGKSKILLDAETGSVIIGGNHLISNTSDVNFMVSEKNSFGVNSFPLDFRWLSKKSSALIRGPKGEIPETCPVTFKNWLGQGIQFISGVPAPGQRLVEFSEVFSSKPLFILPKTLEIASEISKILEELGK